MGSQIAAQHWMCYQYDLNQCLLCLWNTVATNEQEFCCLVFASNGNDFSCIVGLADTSLHLLACSLLSPEQWCQQQLYGAETNHAQGQPFWSGFLCLVTACSCHQKLICFVLVFGLAVELECCSFGTWRRSLMNCAEVPPDAVSSPPLLDRHRPVGASLPHGNSEHIECTAKPTPDEIMVWTDLQLFCATKARTDLPVTWAHGPTFANDFGL